MPYLSKINFALQSNTFRTTLLVCIGLTIGCAQPQVSGSQYDAEPESSPEPTTFQETVTEDVEPESPVVNPMVRLHPGAFIMGTTFETGRWENEGPQHTVAFTRTVEMQSHEVTQQQWEFAFDSQPSKDTTCGKDCPVESVNWYEALHYANWLSQSEGLETCYNLIGCDESCIGCGRICEEVEFSGLDCQGYRLPTEAEWEYAARAGTHTAYYNGHASNENKSTTCSQDSSLDNIGWYCANAGSSIQPVAGLLPNAWGLFDMSGNVQEWVWDRYGDYSSRAITDPLGAQTGDLRVARGGAWDYISAGCRAAYREPLTPETSNDTTGFRLARTLSF
jgi:formylglycine-generating enzyme required for sulfatase activity